MGFDTPAGTRGGRQPRAGLILRLASKNAAAHNLGLLVAVMRHATGQRRK